MVCQGHHGSFPRQISWPRRDSWLGDVVEHEAHVGKVAHQLDGGRKLTGSQEKVVDQICIADRADPAPHAGAQEPPRIRLVVDLVADAHQRAAPGSGAQLLKVSATEGSVRSTQPTTPAMKSVLAAVLRNSRVSSRLEIVCTNTVRSIPVEARSGASSSGPKGRRIEARPSPIHG